MDKKSLEVIRMRDNLFRPRCALNIINLIIHTVNLMVLHQTAESIATPDPQVAKFLAMRFRYLTTWVVILHVFYSVSALTMEVYHKMIESQEIGRNPQDPIEKLEIMQNYPSEILFRGIIWPATIVVTVIFWSVFNYDRELIFPKFVDEVVSCGSNHILHTWIAIFIFLEMLVHPRLRPRHTSLGQASAWRAKLIFLAVYAFVFYYTLFTEDIWLYPIFSVAYNSGIIYFLFLHLVILLLYLNTTRFFWSINNHFHKERQWIKKQTRN